MTYFRRKGRWPKRRNGESSIHYARRTGLCFHRWAVMKRVLLEDRIAILARCRWCTRVRSEIINFDKNSLSVYGTRTLMKLETILDTPDINSPRLDPDENPPPSTAALTSRVKTVESLDESMLQKEPKNSTKPGA